ncbi:MAG: DUF6206 family protein [candidate division KSB1 bacterium]|nr:DUF6206 family protein [candidate division KSB1 bacterium]
MNIDHDLIHRFEAALDPQDLAGSPIPATILGFGEISTIFQIGDDDTMAYKRMPLFKEASAATRYEQQYHEYCRLLTEAGLHLPDHATMITDASGKVIALYIAQQQFPAERFAHRLLHRLDLDAFKHLITRVLQEIDKVWNFNQHRAPEIELSLDGQLSNWVDYESKLFFVDTSTPLYRKQGVEQMDPEPLLKSAPGFLRWILRLFFLDDVMNRYYQRRLVFLDLAANLFKEGRADLIPVTIELINQHLTEAETPLTTEEVSKYYRQDKLIWTLFLAFRRVDRWLRTRIFRQRYEFILPGTIRR